MEEFMGQPRFAHGPGGGQGRRDGTLGASNGNGVHLNGDGEHAPSNGVHAPSNGDERGAAYPEGSKTTRLTLLIAHTW